MLTFYLSKLYEQLGVMLINMYFYKAAKEYFDKADVLHSLDTENLVFTPL